jgi:methionine-gamma-lyase
MNPDHHADHINTLAVHAGREDLVSLGVHALPLDLSTTYPVVDIADAAADLDAWTHGAQHTDSNPIYARLFNPTVGRCESAVAQLEGAEAAVAFASGMGALTAVLLALQPDRRHVVGVRPLYGTTDHLLASGLLGVEVTYTSAADVAAAIRPDTGLVIIESPQNPTVTLVDIAAVAAAAGAIPVLVDNTFATPVLQQPLKHGATLVLHSATKAIGGHGDAMGGFVCCSEDWASRLRQVRVATGALLHPLGAYQLHRGVATLPLRVRAMQEGAAFLAERLADHSMIERVYYPGLPGQDPDGLIGRQMLGPGTMLSFDVRGGSVAVRALLASVRLATHAVSLGSVDTLIQHPASLTHRIMQVDDRASWGIGEGLVRMSVGLEDPTDLWTDISNALAAASTATSSQLASSIDE